MAQESSITTELYINIRDTIPGLKLPTFSPASKLSEELWGRVSQSPAPRDPPESLRADYQCSNCILRGRVIRRYVTRSSQQLDLPIYKTKFGWRSYALANWRSFCLQNCNLYGMSWNFSSIKSETLSKLNKALSSYRHEMYMIFCLILTSSSLWKSTILWN